MEARAARHTNDGTPAGATVPGETPAGGDGAREDARAQGSPPGALVPVDPAMLEESSADEVSTDDHSEATDLSVIAERIREAQWKIDAATVRGAFEIGGLIARAAAPLGDKRAAIAWVERECGIAKSTGYDYCRIYEGLSRTAWLIESLTINAARSLVRARAAAVLAALPEERPPGWDAARLNETLAAIPPAPPARAQKGHRDGEDTNMVAEDVEEKGEDRSTPDGASGSIIATHAIDHGDDVMASADTMVSPEIVRPLLHQVREGDPFGTGPLSPRTTSVFADRIAAVSAERLPMVINRIRRLDPVELVRLLEERLPDADRPV